MAQQTMLFSDAHPETVPAAIVSPPTGDMLRDDGIRRAAEHADLCIPSWTDRALRFVRDYPESVFRTEQVRAWAHDAGLPLPPSARAWGSVIVMAKKLGLIKFLRHENVSNPKAHSTPASVWQKIGGGCNGCGET